jgi:hypothetical protein
MKTKEDGALHGTPSATTIGSGTMVKKILANIVDPAYLGNDAYYVDDSGNFYTKDGGTFTKDQTDSTNTYTLGTTDLIHYKGEIFATATDEVTKLTANLAAIDTAWWTTTRGHSVLNGNYRHPMEVVEDTLYIADEYKIHTWDGTTSVAAAMSLPPDVNITSLRKHPDGRHLIAFCGVTANYSHTQGGGGKAYIIDTVNLEWTQEIPLESQVEGSRVVSGVVYVTYGKNFGYFDGSALQWLRDLETSGTTYSHCITDIEGTVAFRDGDEIICYGDVGAGNVFWNLKDTGTSALSALLYVGDNTIQYSYDASGTGVLKEIDLDNSTEGLVEIVTNPISTAGELWLRKVSLAHDNPTGYCSFRYQYYDEDQELTEFRQIEYNVGGGPAIPRRTRVDLNARVESANVRVYQESGTAAPFYKLTIEYESAE